MATNTTRVDFIEGSAPATPGTGEVSVYAKADGLVYSKDDAGTETLMSSGAGGLTDHNHTTGGDGGDLDAPVIDGYAIFNEEAAPSTPASATVAIYAKSDGLMYSKDDAGVETLMSSGAGGGGGATHSYVGYNTIGGSNEAPTKQTRSYFKEFTPGSSGMLLSIGVYIDQTATDAYTGFTVALNADNSSSPGQLLAWNGSSNNDGNQAVFEKNSSGVGDPGWVHMPVSFYCTGGTKYWMQVLFLNNGATNHIYYDTSGSDPINNNGGSNAVADGRRYTLSDSTKKYSIRGDYLA